MYCESCGEQLDGRSSFCPKCGAKVDATAFAIEESGTKKHLAYKKIKVACIIVVAFLSICIFLDWVLGDEIDGVKNGTLTSYSYGKSIGESLEDWFDGDVTWDSYEEDDTVFVTASGICPYMADMYDDHQTFIFQIVDDDHFQFLGAYDSDGYEIFSKSKYGIIDTYANIASLVGVDLYESALKAAFGDEQSLNSFKDM